VSILSVLDALNRAEEYRSYGGGFFSGTVSLSDVQRGESLSQEDSQGIEETLYQLVACANAVSPLQVLGLFSTEYQAILAVEAIDENNFDSVLEHLPMLATQTADLAGIPQLTIIDNWYDPGTNKTIHAVVQPYLAESDVAVQFLVTFQWDTDKWVISWIVPAD
jgi:ABC-type branched-subunit amino acid transport system substrate-binding protein